MYTINSPENSLSIGNLSGRHIDKQLITSRDATDNKERDKIRGSRSAGAERDGQQLTAIRCLGEGHDLEGEGRQVGGGGTTPTSPPSLLPTVSSTRWRYCSYVNKARDVSLGDAVRRQDFATTPRGVSDALFWGCFKVICSSFFTR